MKTSLSAAVLVGLAAALAFAPCLAADSTERRASPAVAQLITDLGSSDYAVRQRAEQELISLGADAFDDLKLAESSDDLEIASRAHYILEQLRVEWTRPDDSEPVRTILVRFGDLSDSDKEQQIERLDRLRHGAGLAALCRIARFDPSPLVARRAALAVLDEPTKRLADKATACRRELGASERTPVQWEALALQAAEPSDPKTIAAKQAEAIDAETALVKKNSPETTALILYELLEQHLDWCRRAELAAETTQALQRTVLLAADQADDGSTTTGLAWALRWIMEHKQWQVLTAFRGLHEAEFEKDRKLLYYLAGAVQKSGSQDEADRLATRAFNLANNDGDKRVGIASALAQLGFVDWSEREYRGVIEREPVLSSPSLEARTELATWLADRENYRGASDILGELAAALDAEAGAKERFIKQLDANREGGREILSAALARQEYYRALDLEQQKKFDDSRDHLVIAAATYERDPDILIAMYRSPGANKEFRESTQVRVNRVSKFQQELIDEFPQYASNYNQWAWLVANTEGDYARAVEYSKKSLELAPDEPSFLDTLGRCEYAAGHLEEAVKAQRKAVELAPQYEVMKRQLAQFERELAEKNKGEPPRHEGHEEDKEEEGTADGR